MNRKTCSTILAFLMVALFAVTASADPVIVNFSISPEKVVEGETATLTWETTGADIVTINNGIGNVAASGSMVITPGATMSYSIAATCSTCKADGLVIFSGGTTTGKTVNATQTVTVTPRVGPTPTPTVSAPTMNEWGMMFLILCMGAISAYRIRRMNRSK